MRCKYAGLLLVAPLVLGACSSSPAPETTHESRVLDRDVQGTLADFKSKDPSLDRFFNNSYAYAIFPTVTSGAAGIGAAHGDGQVYQGGKLVGYADLTQGSIGAQLGGQTYSELIFFENEAALTDFKNNQLAFDARANAVAASTGAAATADYRRGVVVFSKSQGGLMFQASIGGQQFRYENKDSAHANMTASDQ